MTEPDITSRIAHDLAQSMFELLREYSGHEKTLANLMASQLASLVSLTAVKPDIALNYYANYLATFDWASVRRDHFAHRLGIKQTLGPTESKVINMGDPNDRPKPQDD